MIDKKTVQSVVSLLKRSNKILLMPSSPPDGDSLGSALALYLILKKIGKDVTVVSADSVPEVYQFFPNQEIISDQLKAITDFIVTIDCTNTPVENIYHTIENNKINIVITPRDGKLTSRNVTFSDGDYKYDLIVTLDAGDLDQIGKLYTGNLEFFEQIPLINIDHHTSNSNFGKLNMVDSDSASTTQALMPVIEELGEGLIDADIATLLLAGLITDTGSFQNPNTTPESLALAAQLSMLGARQQEIIKHIYKTKRLSTLKLWGRILSKIQFDKTNKIVWSTVTREDFEETGSESEETGGIIDELITNAPGAEIFILLKYKDIGLYSGSVRTIDPKVNASDLAHMFGGGGHKQAAGFRLPADNMTDAENKMLEKVREFQKNRLNNKIEENASGKFPTPLDMLTSDGNEKDLTEERIKKLGAEFFNAKKDDEPKRMPGYRFETEN